MLGARDESWKGKGDEVGPYRRPVANMLKKKQQDSHGEKQGTKERAVKVRAATKKGKTPAI